VTDSAHASGARGDTARLAALTRELDQTRQELDAVIYAISHDVKAPLRSITAFNQLLQESNPGLDDQSQHCLTRIQEGVSRLGALIDALLQLSRVNHADLAVREIDVSELAGEAATAARARHPDRTISISIQPALRAYADSRLLKTALVALLDNACKFTISRVDTKISIGALADVHPPTFFVKDNGVGFNNTYASKLGRPFQRLHSEPHYGGVGIGLAIVQRIVGRHGGRLWGESAVDEGATLYFTLPAADST
jgi:light-regulated signal transduction histidine kinase (bacteriophytochrome)